MKYPILLAVLLAAPVASAAPIFLTSDALCFDPTGGDSSCPAGFEYSEDAGTTWNNLDGEVVDTQIVVMHEVSTLPLGSHIWEIRSVNAWGVSDSVPFDFSVGVPVAPTGLRLIAPPE